MYLSVGDCPRGTALRAIVKLEKCQESALMKQGEGVANSDPFPLIVIINIIN